MQDSVQHPGPAPTAPTGLSPAPTGLSPAPTQSSTHRTQSSTHSTHHTGLSPAPTGLSPAPAYKSPCNEAKQATVDSIPPERTLTTPVKKVLFQGNQRQQGPVKRYKNLAEATNLKNIYVTHPLVSLFFGLKTTV